MSFSERAILWLHVGVAIFTIGPVTAAIMSTPRYIRKRNPVIVGYLYRVTRLYAIASLLLFIFGIILADMLNELSKPWLSISMTLYVVAIVLLVLIIRDQRKAVAALESVAASAARPPVPVASTPALTSAPAPATDPTAASDAAPSAGADADSPDSGSADSGSADSGSPDSGSAESAKTGTDTEKAAAQPAPPVTAAPAESPSERIAAVERGRIASLAGVTGLIWLVILILMVWR
ncbi:MAG TPA: hypothetical protein VK817_08595 [Trebonia sp.]|jgi:hypothetical protein|nr:hypothetical protein [Trebonia sp.]